MENYYIAQLVGILGFILCLSGFLQKNDNKLKILVAIGALTISAHFYIMGSMAAAFAAFISSTRYYFASNRYSKFHIKISIFYVSLYLITAYFAYQTYVDIFPILGGVTGTLSLFFLNNIKMRLGIIITAILWLTHNIIKFSIGGIALETMNIIANLITVNKIRRGR